ncbi:MAG: LL-diaminopimelate aminotransferase [Desulfarculales bacterium]|nr:LL-diaminopimelate aminotransferase [Desulfarculales bacterium]
MFQKAQRLQQLPPYLFKEIDRLRDEVRRQGKDIIDLGVGDPDQPTFANIVTELRRAAQDPATHRYPAYSGLSTFRQEAARWYKERFQVSLEPLSEVVTLIGSKEGLAHFPLAFVNPGEVVLVPDPAYPVYSAAAVMAGGIPVKMPLRRDNNFLPDLQAIPAEALKKAKMLVINYPNNPTAAVAEKDFYAAVVEFALRHKLIVVSDAAYTEIAYDGYRPLSFMEIDGAKEVGIEFHSLSKTFNMTGWRLGFAVGNAELVAGLGQVKSQIDSGAFDAVQLAGIAALKYSAPEVKRMCALYQERRDVLVAGLQAAGLDVTPPKASFYVWAPCPPGYSSSQFTMKLLTEIGVVSTPGSGFGQAGEGYVRFALTVDKRRLREAVKRLRSLEL